MKYFLTGATGFIGGRLALKLIDAGHHVRCLVRSTQKAAALAERGAQIFEGDVTDLESMRAPMEGVDGVFHVAAWYKVGELRSDVARRVNVDGTRHVLRLMKELGIPKGVYTSTLAVFSDTKGKMVDEDYRFIGRHLSEYDYTKWVAHYQVAMPLIREGFPLTIVQPGLVYGSGDTSSVRDTLVKYLRRRLPMAPRQTAFCWAHVDDVADAHILAMEKGRTGESYIIAGEPRTLVDALDVAERITGIRAPRLRPSPATMNLLAKFIRPFDGLSWIPASYRSESLRTVAGVTYLGDNSKARRELGYNPRSLEEGLRETLEHEMELLGIRPRR